MKYQPFNKPSWYGRENYPKRAYGLAVGNKVRYLPSFVQNYNLPQECQHWKGQIVDILDDGIGIAVASVLWDHGFEEQVNIKNLQRNFNR